MELEDSDFDCLFQDIPKEKLKEYSKILRKLEEPSKRELKDLERASFVKILRKVRKVDPESSFEILKKFYKEIGVSGGGYHKRYMKAADKALWRIEDLIEDEREFQSMMIAEMERICDKDD